MMVLRLVRRWVGERGHLLELMKGTLMAQGLERASAVESDPILAAMKVLRSVRRWVGA